MGIDIGILHVEDKGFSYLDIADELTDKTTRAKWDRDLTDRVRGVNG